MVPQPVYPESTHSSLSSPLNSLLKTKLREHSLILRRLSSSLRASGSLSDAEVLATLRSKKEELLKEVYSVMSATLGVPPQPDEKFVWDYYDKNGKPGSWEGTAREFYKVLFYYRRFGLGAHTTEDRHLRASNTPYVDVSRSFALS